jgi:hypothetical protein
MFSARLSHLQLLLLSFSFFILSAEATQAGSLGAVTLRWDRNPEMNVAGYRVYYGRSNLPFTQTMDVTTNSARIPELVTGPSYSFAVSAFNTFGAQSTRSQSISAIANAYPAGGQVTLDNLSTRIFVQTGENVMIGGFIVRGDQPKRVVLRAIGPSLAAAGVKGALLHPLLEVRNSAGRLVATNGGWHSGGAEELSALGLAPTDTREAALVITLPAGSYSVAVRGKGATKGVGLFELYNLDRTQGSLPNISTRGRVGIGDQVMIGGFIIGGNKGSKVIVRALGPSLTAHGVSDTLQDPTLELYDSDGTLVAKNDNWRSNQQTAIIISTIPPTDGREAAIVATLAPGAYSAIVRGHNGSTGVALFEVYALSH